MSGHSKWAQIKRQKEAVDQKRGKVFSRLSKAIAVAVKEKGGDPKTNFALRLAIEKAKATNMPQANIERAIKKGKGKIEGGLLEEVFYEIYGPGGVAMVLQAITDNKNRTVSDLKSILSKSGGRLGGSNSVRWLFEERGVVKIKVPEGKREVLILNAIEAGADDVKEEENDINIIIKKEDFQKVKERLEKNYKIEEAEIKMIPQNPLENLDPKIKKQVEFLLAQLEDYDDTANIFTNLKV